MKMPVSEDALPEQIDYKQKYKNLKRKLKFLIYENECFQEDLRKSQRKLLKVNRDKSFLLDRLLQFERIDESSSDTDATVSSDSEIDVSKLDAHVSKSFRKKTVAQTSSEASDSVLQSQPVSVAQLPNVVANKPASDTSKRKKPATQKNVKIVKSQPQTATGTSKDGHMTAEEIERHLESRQNYLDLLPGRTPLTVPNEMFSNDPSSIDRMLINGFPTFDSEPYDGTGGDSSPSILGDAVGEDDMLVIDLPEPYGHT